MLVDTLLYKHRAPMTQTELGKDLHLSRQTVTSVVDSLERSGYVQRGTAEGDRRVRIVALTDTGRAFAGSWAGHAPDGAARLRALFRRGAARTD